MTRLRAPLSVVAGAMRRTPMLVSVALILAPGAARSQGAEMSGLSADTILARMRAAAGGDRLSRVGSFRAELAVRAYGMAGQGILRVDLSAKAYRRVSALGPASEGEGYTGHDAWLSDATEDIRIQNGSPEAKTLVDAAYRETFGLFFPNRWPAAITTLGRIDGNFRLHVAPRGGAAFSIDVDPTTYRIVRVIERVGDGTETTSFGDYRFKDGVLFPFERRIESESGVLLATTSKLTISSGEDGTVSKLPVSRTDTRFTNNYGSTTVPIELANHHIYVHVSLNGGPAGLYLLDTGAQNILSPAAAEHLGLRVVGGAQGSGVGENVESFRFAEVSTMQIGDAILKNQPFQVLPFVATLERSDDVVVDGAIGFEVLKRFVTRIDFNARTLTLATHIAPRGKAVPFVFYDRIPVVAGSADNIPGLYTIDTGSGGILQLNGPFATRHGFFERYNPTVQGIVGGGIGGGVRAALIRLHAFTLGGVQFHALPIQLSQATAGGYSDESIAGNVGDALLERFSLTFDYAHRTMYLEPSTGTDRVIDHSGMRVRRDAHGNIQIYSVLDGSPAKDSGVLVGDIIRIVDGVNAGDLKLDAIRDKLSGATGTVVHLRILRANTDRDVDVPLRDLV